MHENLQACFISQSFLAKVGGAKQAGKAKQDGEAKQAGETKQAGGAKQAGGFEQAMLKLSKFFTQFFLEILLAKIWAKKSEGSNGSMFTVFKQDKT